MAKINHLFLGLYAQTAIHAGTGQNEGIIDLPIMRESHNGWPCVYGSAMKGAFRCFTEDKINQVSNTLFGKTDNNNQETHAGALLIGDARLLLLPIRSLTTQFKWVTSPAALQRLKLDGQRFGQRFDFEIPTITDAETVIITKEKGKTLYLEEYRLTQEVQDLTAIIDVLATLMNRDDAKEVLTEQLAIVSDDNFAFLATNCTPVNAHIALDSKTKTTTQGALWYQETLPSDTLMYCGLAVQASRDGQDEQKPVKDLITVLKQQGFIQVGGNETVGMGWFGLSILSDEGN